MGQGSLPPSWNLHPRAWPRLSAIGGADWKKLAWDGGWLCFPSRVAFGRGLGEQSWLGLGSLHDSAGSGSLGD